MLAENGQTNRAYIAHVNCIFVAKAPELFCRVDTIRSHNGVIINGQILGFSSWASEI